MSEPTETARATDAIAAAESAPPASGSDTAARRTKILLVDTSEKGALPLYTAMIAQALSQAGATPIVLANDQLVDPQIGGGWKVRRELRAGPWPPPPGAPSPSALRQLVRWASLAVTIVRAVISERPHIIHFQHPLHPRLDALLVRVLGALAPVVWTAHDVLPHDVSSNGAARAAAIYQASSLTLVHSPPATAEVLRLSGVAARIVRHPVRAMSAPCSRAEARQRLGIGPNERVACAVGFIRSYKGYGLLSETLALIKRPDFRLLVVGQLVDQTEQAVLDKLATDARADLRIGYASDDGLITAITASDVMLLPHAAGSDSGSLHMARALSVPVLASDAPQLSSVVAATGAGRVLAREPAVWAAALEDDLPPRPPPPPTLQEIGYEHIAAYQQLLRHSS